MNPLIKTSSKPPATPTRNDLQIIDAASSMAAKIVSPDDLVYSARELILATLPHRSPPLDQPVWARQNGDYTLLIRPGYRLNPDTGQNESIGYPSGTIPRLLMFWLTTEAIRRRSGTETAGDTDLRTITLSNTLSEFLREIGLNPETGGGKRSDASRLRQQMDRLFNASISFQYTTKKVNRWLNMPVTSAGELWWDDRAPDQVNLFESWITLSSEFYDALVSHPVPVDVRALHALKASPLALDLYAWLCYRTYTVNRRGKPAFVTWRQLAKQLGSNYRNIKDFKKAVKAVLRKIKVLYPNASVEDVHGGLDLRPGLYLIPPKHDGSR